jgi:Cof subfamily protein (haloacid dehalogenase superfamily)
MPIRLVAIDIDGTLLDSSGKLPEENRKAIGWASRRGVKVILVTGRRWAMAWRVANDLGLSDPLVAHNGALVKSPVTLQRLAARFIGPQVALGILGQTHGYLKYLVLHRDAGINGQTVVHPACGDNLRIQSYLGQFPEAVVECLALESMIDTELIQIMFGGDLSAMIDLENLLTRSNLIDRVKLTKTHYPDRNLGIVDLLDANCSKRTALEFLAESYEIPRQDVMAIGDNHNDLEMLEYAGVGVTVSNCVEELKDRGFETVCSNADGGVAEALYQYLG